MKSLYHEEYHTYLPRANELDIEVTEILRPVFEKYMEEGYSPREVSQIMGTSIAMIECEYLLDRNNKIAKAKRKKKDGAPKKPVSGS